MKRCPIAAKITRSIGMLPCCVLNDFSHWGMNVFQICEASISHHTIMERSFSMVQTTACIGLCMLQHNITFKQILVWPIKVNTRYKHNT